MSLQLESTTARPVEPYSGKFWHKYHKIDAWKGNEREGPDGPISATKVAKVKFIHWARLLGLIGIGTMYAILFSPDEAVFSYIAVGEDSKTVMSLMGKPQRIERQRPLLSGVDYEFEYYLWPMHKFWCVGFRKDQVIKKGILLSSLTMIWPQPPKGPQKEEV